MWVAGISFFVANLVLCSSFSIFSFKTIPQNYSSQLTLNGTEDALFEHPEVHYIKHRTFIPFARPLRDGEDNSTEEEGCDSSDDFPAFLTEDVRDKGGFVLCFIVGIYCFTLLALVCDRYFVPCVEVTCDIFHLTPDVAAATFMSVATSTPELFTNIIGTFITESDIGIGTIVGSSLYQALGVAAIGGLAAPYPLQLDWWPLTRDVCIYSIAVSLLVVITWDGKIFWYEALVLFVIYFVYFTVMFQNHRISKWVKSHFQKDEVVDLQKDKDGVEVKAEPRPSVISAYGSYVEEISKPGYDKEYDKAIMEKHEEEKREAQRSVFKAPEGGFKEKFFFYYSWPISVALRYTVPNPKLHPKMFPLTFLMCIIWIGTNSYMVSWMVTIIGSVFRIPDAVLGLSFLAAGSGLPESISMAIISRRGEGAFGVSNSLGANTMNILFSLGMPWFFKTISQGATNSSFIQIQSGSIEYTILALIGVVAILYATIYFNKFRLGKMAGVILLSTYLVCVVMAILSEMVFFDNSLCLS
ncbi:hypothetical protein NQ318_020144 [Aromia moschata]|uniref:Sodium/calcium exchanger membrane region domain-containing protein n=1 Tax=Aromia moschata TaxID=1265417 RepID=A0AAV8Z977_9CUCU|nr:hypothetical protein NQ318_020144 [Aromia moschata]